MILYQLYTIMWIVYGLIPPPSRSKNQALSPPTPQKPKVTLSPCRGLCYCQGLDLHSYTLWVGIGEWTKWRVAIRQGFRKKWEVWHQEKTASLLYPVGRDWRMDQMSACRMGCPSVCWIDIRVPYKTPTKSLKD
jgi:hypothetical protein